MASTKVLFSLVVVCFAVYGIAGTEERPQKKYSLCMTESFYQIFKDENLTSPSVSNPLDMVAKPDVLTCLESVAAGETDCYMISDRELLFAATFERKFDDLRLFMNVTEENWRENSRTVGAVVRKDLNVTSPADLRGRRAGFMITHEDAHVWFYMKLKQLGLLTDKIDPSRTLTENILEQLSNYFSTACLMPQFHPKSAGKSLRRMLNTTYRSLQAACGERVSLSSLGQPWMFELHRLRANDVDVAFTIVIAAQTFLADVAEQYDFLCVDGTRQPLDADLPCAWITQPGDQYITNPKKIDSMDELRRSVARYSVDVAGQVLPHMAAFSTYENPISTRQYLEDIGLFALWLPKQIDGHTMRTFEICVVSDANLERCQRVNNQSYYSNNRPETVCVVRNSTEECLEYVKNNGGVHAIDPYYYDVAKEKYHLRPIAVHVHRKDEPSGTVALIRADSNVRTWGELRGARSCHTALESNTGLVVPLHVLHKRGLIRTPVCPAVNAISEFFSGGSCLPGANTVDKSSEKLCALCAGDVDGKSSGGVGKCAADLSEAYYGDVGALRCLFERRGDVAFVDIAQLSNLKETAGLEWTKGVKRDDFKVLTLNDKRFSIAQCLRNVDECTLMKQLPHVFVTKSDTPDVIVQEMQDYFDRKVCWISDCRELYAVYDTYHDERAYKFSRMEKYIQDFDDHVTIAEEYEKILKQVKSC